LIPEQALVDSARWYLQLDAFDDGQILERQLQAQAESPSANLIPQVFLDAVASGDPTPGGGSVAALAGALGAALAAMVARATLGKKKYADAEAAMNAVTSRADDLRAALTRLIVEDSAAFEEVMAAYRLPKDDPNRPAAIQTAIRRAAEVPLGAAQLAVETLDQLKVVASQGNVNAASDAAAGALIANAALEAAAMNVLINVQSLEDTALVETLKRDIQALRQTGAAALAEIKTQTETRAGLK
jgi:glutamate formiminotransferase/formiminotetrahydrofolate cyclodeaminase